MELLNWLMTLALLTAAIKAIHRKGWLFFAALLSWAISEVASNFIFNNWSSAGYVLFYPLIYVAIPSLFEIDQKGELVKLIDGAVLVLGTSTVATALLFKSISADFLHILYPICDLILLIAVFICFVRRPVNLRSALLLLGFLIYSATDFLYLWQVSHFIYKSNSVINYGWHLAFAILIWAQFYRGISSESFPPIPFFYLAVSVASSITILALVANNLYQIPKFVIAPAIATLVVTFIRLTFALKQNERAVTEQSLAKIDDLTGLPNRRRFVSELDNYLDGSIMLMDLDGFKPVNDNFGHETGDQLLKLVSKRFIKALPDDALLARLGGDEFAALTKEDYESTLEIAMALRATLSYPFNVNGEQIRIDVSIGCVANDGKTDLMSRADTAMYKAKRAQVGVWTGGT